MTIESIDRRTVLCGAAAVAGTAALAACSSGGSKAASTAEGTAIGSIPKTTDPASASNAALAENTLGKSSLIAVGSGTIFASQKVVVTQPAAGTYKAFSAICTHQGCVVNDVAAGKIMCPCHGSEFSIKDGSVLQGPATSPLKEVKVAVTGGQVKLA